MKKFLDLFFLNQNYWRLKQSDKRTLKINVIYFLAICISMATACKSKQKDIASSAKTEPNAKTESTVKTEPTAVTAKTIGKVSHEYRATGCATVVVIPGGTKPLILIPKNKLPDDMDVDGLEISFNYRTLKTPQPAGCTKGIPAELRDVTKK